jgi:hypothetical protein
MLRKSPHFPRLLLGWIFACPIGAWGAAPVTLAPVDFAREIQPLLAGKCYECHGKEKAKGGLRLISRSAALQGGESGEPSLVPGQSARSLLLQRVTTHDEDDVMPQKGARLTSAEIDLLRRWIDAGAVWPDNLRHWAYVKPVRPPTPRLRHTADAARNPIDHFVFARLEQAGLAPAPSADRARWLRRVSLDLIGLPPTPAEVAAFEADQDERAFERVVDRLLASPQFGERWARPWLDLARYADSHGFQRDDLRDLWPYRDWVIRALNADLPFDRFTVWQLAGDLLPEAERQGSLDPLIATGFHRAAPTNVEAGTDQEEGRVNQVFDRVNTTAAVWLGTTMECAQCHDHKYDPFSMRDYYRLFAFFNSTAIETEFTTPKAMAALKFVGPYLTLPAPEGKAPVPARAPDAPAKAGRPAKGRAVAKAAAKPAVPPAPRTLVMQELPEPRPTAILKRGSFLDRGEPVTPGLPEALHPVRGGEVRNRLDLARWLVDPENPLVARVTVNRWWAEIFGRGLVATPEDFGVKGEPPTHPELLDWLAVEFMEHGWSMKHILRLIALSATYRQSSRVSSAMLAQDDQNRLLARGPRLRLDAESIRDNALAAAGLLSLRMEGPPVRPYQPPGLWESKVGGDRVTYTVSEGEDAWRRGIYTVWKRSSPYPSFMNFDAPGRTACTVQRSRSNTPLQALTLLNDQVYVEAAQALAKRVVREVPTGSAEERVRHAFRLCLARSPAPVEVAALLALFEQQRAAHGEEVAGWTAVATALLNLDEMITKG